MGADAKSRACDECGGIAYHEVWCTYNVYPYQFQAPIVPTKPAEYLWEVDDSIPCSEFKEFGSCIHSDCMAKAGM